MKLELSKDTYAEVKDGVKTRTMIEAIKLAKSGKAIDAQIMMLEEVIEKLVIEGADVTENKMDAFENMDADKGGMKLLAYADNLFAKAAASREDKKK